MLKIQWNNPYIRYLAPLGVFLALGVVQGFATDPLPIWALYGLKVTVAAIVFWFLFSGHWHEIAGRFDIKAMLLGIAVCVIWIPYCHYFAPDAAATFDPSELPAMVAVAAIAVRILGASIVTPLIEETVWRSFIMRFLIKDDFLSVPLGAYTFWSFWGTALSFMIVHPMWQWPVALLAGVAYGYYLVRTKNLKGCIIAHGVTNLGISIYAIATGTWGLWG